MKPLVSIIFITYNQKKYVAEAIESFLMQKTNFDFEILIHDDASTDGTIDVIRRYEQENPKQIKTYFEKENQHSKANLQFLDQMFRDSKGGYIALCEGDDYWTDPLKLQKQVDYMQKNKNCALCFHPVKVVFEDGEMEDQIFPDEKQHNKFSLEGLLKGNYIQTNSVMYKRQKYDNLKSGVMPNDLYLHLYHAQNGSIGFINEVMANYRKHQGGLWWDKKKSQHKVYAKHYKELTAFYERLLEMFDDNNEYISIINNHLRHLLNQFVETDIENNTKIMTSLSKQYPDIVSKYIIDNKKRFDEISAEHIRVDKKLGSVIREINEYKTDINKLEKQINQIQQSRSYKFARRVAKAKGRLKK